MLGNVTSDCLLLSKGLVTNNRQGGHKTGGGGEGVPLPKGGGGKVLAMLKEEEGAQIVLGQFLRSSLKI